MGQSNSQMNQDGFTVDENGEVRFEGEDQNRGDGACIQFTAVPEFTAVNSGEQKKIIALASIKAAAILEEARTEDGTSDGAGRGGLSIVCVVDKSGSMSGSKIELMKKTLEFVVTKGLRSNDELCIVSYDSSVSTSLSWTPMDAAGKKGALEKIRGLRPGSATNLSGGLFQGLTELVFSSDDRPVKTVLLFTDGLANNGIMDTVGITAGMHNMQEAAGTKLQPSVFTFGFGADHDEDMLRAIAQAGSGLYYFVEDADTIPAAFADCLGGLVSVVAQNISLEIFPAQPGVVIEGTMGKDNLEELQGGGKKLVLGDIYSEEERDLLFHVQLPVKLAAEDAAAPFVHFKLTYFDVAAKNLGALQAAVAVARPLVAPSNQPINQTIDKHRNRLNVAAAMENAARLADRGEMDLARGALRESMAAIDASYTANVGYCVEMKSEVEDLLTDYSDQVAYRAVGSKKSKMAAMSAHRQRATHAIGNN